MNFIYTNINEYNKKSHTSNEQKWPRCCSTPCVFILLKYIVKVLFTLTYIYEKFNMASIYYNSKYFALSQFTSLKTNFSRSSTIRNIALARLRSSWSFRSIRTRSWYSRRLVLSSHLLVEEGSARNYHKWGIPYESSQQNFTNVYSIVVPKVIKGGWMNLKFPIVLKTEWHWSFYCWDASMRNIHYFFGSSNRADF